MPFLPATFVFFPTEHHGARSCTPEISRQLSSLALEAPIGKVHCAAYNVSTESNNLTVAEIAQSVVDVVPGAKLLITGETGADPRSYRVDFSAFRRKRSVSKPHGQYRTAPPSFTRNTLRPA